MRKLTQEEIDNELSELRQRIWIELWAIDDVSSILDIDQTKKRIIIASLKNSNKIILECPEDLLGEITPLFLETLRQEFVNAKIIESDYQTITDKVDDTLQEIKDEILNDYNRWKDRINRLIERINDTSAVLNEQVKRSE